MGNSNTSNKKVNLSTTAPIDQVESQWQRVKKTRKYQKLRPAQKKMAKRLYVTLISLGITVALAGTLTLLWMRYHPTNQVSDEDWGAIEKGWKDYKYDKLSADQQKKYKYLSSEDWEKPNIDPKYKKDRPRYWNLSPLEKNWVTTDRETRRQKQENASSDQPSQEGVIQEQSTKT
jgi:hypothetical protein